MCSFFLQILILTVVIKVAKSHALAVRLTDFNLFLQSQDGIRFSHEFYNSHYFFTNLYLLPFVNIQFHNLQHETPAAIVEKIFGVCVWCNYPLCFLPTSLYSKTPKAQTFLSLLFQYGVCCEEDEGCCYLQMQI